MNRLFRWCILAPIISNSLLFSSYSNLRRVGDSLEATDRSDVGSLVLEENDDIIVEAEKIDNFSLDNNLSINDDLLLVTEELDDRYIPRSGNSSYGFNKFKNEEKEEEMKSLYLSLADTCEQFIVSYDDVTPDSKGRYVIGEYDINEFNLTLNETVSVWKIFYVENPAYYWLTNKVTIASQNKLLLMIDKDYSYGVARNKYDKDIKNMLDDCNSLIIDSMSELEKYRIINDYVVSTLNYAYKEGSSLPETSIWAHNLVGSSTKGLGVCESYAKTYMYLCLQNCKRNEETSVCGCGFGGDGWLGR